MYLCWILNITLFCLFGVYLWWEWDNIDSCCTARLKVKSFIRMAIASLLLYIVIMFLYKFFNITGANLLDYLSERRV
jgi:hypothetical protein